MTGPSNIATKRQGEVMRAQRIMRERVRRDPFWHIHLRRELDAGNPYAFAILRERGLEYRDGTIREKA